MSETRKCTKCEQVKPLSAFRYRKQRGIDSSCKSCEIERLRLYKVSRESRLLKDYRHHDKLAGRECNLIRDDVVKLTSSCCVYCGAVDNIGLDRIDNSLGHIHGNVVPCCHICNTMKKLLTREKFIAQCKAVAKFIS